MAQARLPTLAELIADPSILERLPAPIAFQLVERLQQIRDGLVTPKNLPATPVDLAIRYAPYRWMDAGHLHYLAGRVAESVEGCTNLICTMPPQHGKSNTLSHWTPFWYLVRNPHRQIHLTSYEKNFARSWGRKVRALVQLYGKEFGLELDPKQQASDDWKLLSGGGMSCTGVDGAISGRYIGLFIIDDPIKNYEDAHSEVLRTKLWEWWEGTAVQRIQPDTAVIVIGTRYHEDDLIGKLTKGSIDGTGYPFEVVTLPAIALADDPLGRGIDEGLWLGQYGKGQDFYEKKRAGMSAYRWSSVYQQNPTPPGGNTINPEWWRYYYPQQTPVFSKEAMSVDLALDSIKKEDSYQTALVGGVFGQYLYLRDTFHEHCSYMDAHRGIKNLALAYPNAKGKLVERAITGPALVGSLNHEIGGFFLWPPKGQQKASKEVNLDACTPFVQSGNCYLPLTPEGNKPKWVQDFIDELQRFPRGTHDDFVDTFTALCQYLLPSTRIVQRQQDAAQALAFANPPQSKADEQRAAIHSVIRNKTVRNIEALARASQNQFFVEGSQVTLQDLIAGRVAPGIQGIRAPVEHSSGLLAFGAGSLPMRSGPMFKGHSGERRRKMW